jgi:hypothetical protein
MIEHGEEGFSKIVYEYEKRPKIFEEPEWIYRPADKTPLNLDILKSFYNEYGQINSPGNLKKIIFFNVRRDCLFDSGS